MISLTKYPNLDTEQQSYNIPVFAVSKNTLEDMSKSWRILGTLVNNTKESDDISNYWDTTIKEAKSQVAKVPTSKKLKVYYAQTTITETPGPQTIMSSIIHTAGGQTMMNSKSETGVNATNESIDVSPEEIYQFDPDVIVCATAAGKNQIMTSSAWQSVSAVKNNRVYTVTKYAMLDSIQSLMGLVWTAKTLYPTTINLDVNQEIRTFYSKIYLNNNITNDDLAQTN